MGEKLDKAHAALKKVRKTLLDIDLESVVKQLDEAYDAIHDVLGEYDPDDDPVWGEDQPIKFTENEDGSANVSLTSEYASILVGLGLQKLIEEMEKRAADIKTEALRKLMDDDNLI